MTAERGTQLITAAKLLGTVTLLSVAVNLRYPGGERWRTGPPNSLRNVSKFEHNAPHDLALLNGTNVFLILIESCGQTLLQSPHYASKMARLYARLDGSLVGNGWGVVSSILDSPVYGGTLFIIFG